MPFKQYLNPSVRVNPNDQTVHILDCHKAVHKASKLYVELFLCILCSVLGNGNGIIFHRVLRDCFGRKGKRVIHYYGKR